MSRIGKKSWLVALAGCCLLIVLWNGLSLDSGRCRFIVRFLHVRSGMTEAEVTNLLGPPREIAGSKYFGPSHEQGWNQGDNWWYWVEFDNLTGRVIGKRCDRFPEW